MSLSSLVSALATRVGQEIKAVRAEIAALGTAAATAGTVVRRGSDNVTNFRYTVTDYAYIANAPGSASEATRKDYVDTGDTAASTAAATAQTAATAALNAQTIARNATWADWPNVYPTGWYNWSAAVVTKEQGTGVRTPPNALRWNVGAVDAGIAEANAWDDLPLGLEYVTVEIDFLLASGSLTGAGFLLDWEGMSNNRTLLNLAAEVPSPTLNRWHRVTKVLRRPTNATGTHTSWGGYMMGNWVGLGALTAKDIVIDRLALRPATAEEITAYGVPATVTTLTAAIDAAKARATHTGTQSLDTTTDSATRLAMTSAERTKLGGVATGATANSSDATLLARANHTGSQATSTVTGLDTALAAKAPLASPAFTGTPTGITKAHVGLGSVDNTADTAKPVSTAQAAADTAAKARANHTGTQAISTVDGLQTALDNAWLTFTPTWSTTGGAPSLGNGTVTGRYRKTGAKTVEFYILLSIGSTTTGGTGSFRFALPLTADTAFEQITGMAKAYVVNAGGDYAGYGIISTTEPAYVYASLPSSWQTNVMGLARSSMGGAGQSIPAASDGQYAWTTGSNLVVMGQYRTP